MGKTISIYEEGRPVQVFPAPGESYAARKLWVFLVENLRPGLEVALSHETLRLRRDTGREVDPELYKRIMDADPPTTP